MPECVSQTQCSSVPARGTPTKSVEPATARLMRYAACRSMCVRARSAETPVPGIHVQHRHAERLPRLGGPVRVEGVLDRMRLRDDDDLARTEARDLLQEGR